MNVYIQHTVHISTASEDEMDHVVREEQRRSHKRTNHVAQATLNLNRDEVPP